MTAVVATVKWTDAPSGSAAHIDATLVCQLRKLGSGWSARWTNGLQWDVSDQAHQVKQQASRHFKRRDTTKRVVEEALSSGAMLAATN